MSGVDHLGAQFNDLPEGRARFHAEDARFERGEIGINPATYEMHDRHARVTLAPDQFLVSGQGDYSARTVERYGATRAGTTDEPDHRALGRPQVYRHDEGYLSVQDGHHRLLADRLAGRATDVEMRTSADVKRRR